CPLPPCGGGLGWGVKVAASETSLTTEHPVPARFARLDSALAWITELPAAALVVVEIAVLFSGVVARYVFNSPLVWSDGLAAVLMLVIALARLAEFATLREVVLALVIAAAAAAALYLTRPLLMAMGNYNLIVFFVVIVAACIAVGVPIAFAFGVSTMAYLALMTHAPLTIVVNRIDQGMSSLILLSVPLFVFLGVLIEMTGLAR